MRRTEASLSSLREKNKFTFRRFRWPMREDNNLFLFFLRSRVLFGAFFLPSCNVIDQCFRSAPFFRVFGSHFLRFL